MNAHSNILTEASRQWATRPADERFLSLTDMLAEKERIRDLSKSASIPSRALSVAPVEDDESRKGLMVLCRDSEPAAPTHFAFGQLASRVGAPAGYLRDLPADIAADALNWGVFKRKVEDTGILLRSDGALELAAVTGPNYGRVWDADVIKALVDRFGDGVTGDFRVPGEFGKAVDINKSNTTLYASDRDMFVFLADEKNRVEIPNRRNGQSGSLARGFFVWNSEVGSKTLGVSTFLFDYACSNRIVWGAEDVQEFRVRHTVSAPERFVEEVAPAIEAYAQRSTDGIVQAIEAAQAARLDADKVDEFLTKRFTRGQAAAIKAAHLADEDRPIESLWDVTTGATAYARGIKYQDDRVDIERKAGKVLQLAAA